MAEVIREVHRPLGRGIDEPATEVVYRTSPAARIIWFITYIILTLLAIRFVFALLGANPANGLADFVYGVTHPLVSPFFNLFNYNYSDGFRRFETFTLVAMAIYGLVGYGLTRLLTFGRR